MPMSITNNFRKIDPSNWRRGPSHAPAGVWTAFGIHLSDMFIVRWQTGLGSCAHRIANFPIARILSVLRFEFENGASGRITCLSTQPFYGRFTMVCDQD